MALLEGGAGRSFDVRLGYIDSKPMMITRYRFQANIYHVVGFIFAIKLLIFAFDHQLYFLFGDSGSYLYAALTRSAPWDRSFTYGLFLRFLFRHVHSLYFVTFVQTLLSAAAAALVTVMLNKVATVPLKIAGACGILCALEPLQLFSERIILTEAPSTFILAVLIMLAFSYVKTSRAWLLVVIPIFAVYLVSLRVSYLPIVLVTIFLPVFTALTARAARPVGSAIDGGGFSGWSAAQHLVLILLPTVFLFRAYEDWYGKATLGIPSLNQAEGIFLLADVAPIIKASDFEDAAFGKRVLDAVTLNLHEPMLRTGQHFSSGGLCQTLIRTIDPTFSRVSYARANNVAHYAATHAIRNHPIEFIRLIETNIANYFTPREIKKTTAWDEFRDQTIELKYRDLIRKFGISADRQAPPGPIMNWHYNAQLWYMFLIVFPFIPTIYLALNIRRPGLTYLLLTTLYAWTQWAICTILVEHSTPRYETGLAWLVFPIMGLMISHRLSLKPKQSD